MSVPPRDPVDVRAARRAVAVVFGVSGLLYGSWAARIPAVRDHAHLSDGTLGLALACLALGAILAMPVAGAVIARRGSAPVTRTGVVAYAATTAVVALAPSAAAICVLTFLFGAGAGWVDVAMNAHSVTVEQRLRRPVLAGFHAAFSGGGLAGSGLGALAAAAGLDVRIHLAVMAALAVAGGLVASRALLPAAADRAHHAEPVFVRPPRQLWLLGLLAFACLQIEGATGDWSAVYLRDDLGAGGALAALGFTCFSVSMTAGRIVGDRLSGAFGERAVVRGGGALAALGFGIALLVAHPVAALAGCACLGAGMAGVVPIVFRTAGAVPGIAPGVALAATSSTGYFGFLVGPPVIGGIATLTSLPVALGYVVALAALVTALAGVVRGSGAAAQRPAVAA